MSKTPRSNRISQEFSRHSNSLSQLDKSFCPPDNVTIIAITADVDDEVNKTAKKIGIAQVMNKPPRIDVLKAIIKSHYGM